jgi:hypothetical protein
MGGVQWGNVAEWVGGIGTAGAFVATYLLLRHELATRRVQREADERAQANQVAAWMGTFPQDGSAIGGRPVLNVGNQSTSPVYDVVAKATAVDESGVFVEDSWQAFGPVDTKRGTYATRVDKDARVELWFTDSAGLRWNRDADGALNLVGRPDAKASMGTGWVRRVRHLLFRRDGD